MGYLSYFLIKYGSFQIEIYLYIIFQFVCRIYAVYLVFLGLKTIHYPMKDLVGGRFCHFFSFLEPYGAFVGQFHSFFMTVFRYVCLFHSEKMLRHNISPKVTPLLWKYNNFCQILVSERQTIYEYSNSSYSFPP